MNESPGKKKRIYIHRWSSKEMVMTMEIECRENLSGGTLKGQILAWWIGYYSLRDIGITQTNDKRPNVSI